jgi:hypothetical protein
MNRHEDILQQINRIARCSRKFFVETYPGVRDAEVRTAFAYLSEVKGQLIAELAPWLPEAGAKPGHDESDQSGSDGSSADRTSPAAIVEKMYADVHRNFRSDAPAMSANALSFGEEQLLRLVERAFEGSPVSAQKRLLKSYYSQLIICREAMWRLHSRLAA